MRTAGTTRVNSDDQPARRGSLRLCRRRKFDRADRPHHHTQGSEHQTVRGVRPRARVALCRRRRRKGGQSRNNKLFRGPIRCIGRVRKTTSCDPRGEKQGGGTRRVSAKGGVFTPEGHYHPAATLWKRRPSLFGAAGVPAPQVGENLTGQNQGEG